MTENTQPLPEVLVDLCANLEEGGDIPHQAAEVIRKLWGENQWLVQELDSAVDAMRAASKILIKHAIEQARLTHIDAQLGVHQTAKELEKEIGVMYAETWDGGPPLEDTGKEIDLHPVEVEATVTVETSDPEPFHLIREIGFAPAYMTKSGSEFVTAIQWDGTAETAKRICEQIGTPAYPVIYCQPVLTIHSHEGEGIYDAGLGDYVINDPKRGVRKCPDHAFERVYKRVLEDGQPAEEATEPAPEGFVLAGVIGVDAGLCWLGDPCYFWPHDNLGFHKTQAGSLGATWKEFVKFLPESYPTMQQLAYRLGHPGLGVVVSTGFGDGTYPVYVRKTEDGLRVAEVRIIFIDEKEGGE